VVPGKIAVPGCDEHADRSMTQCDLLVTSGSDLNLVETADALSGFAATGGIMLRQ